MHQVVQAILDEEMGGSSFTVLRRHYRRSAGEPVPEREERIPAFGTVHPAGAADLQLFPEEYRTEQVIHIHTAEKLSMGASEDAASYTAPDLILFDGRRWLVFSVRDWSAFGFFRAYAVLQREEGS